MTAAGGKGRDGSKHGRPTSSQFRADDNKDAKSVGISARDILTLAIKLRNLVWNILYVMDSSVIPPPYKPSVDDSS